MGFQVEDGQGSGRRVGVTTENQAKVVAESHELQHHTSWVYGQTYQILGTFTVVGAGTLVPLHVKNTSSTRDAVVTFIRMQFTGDGTIDAATYLQGGFGMEYASGGTAVTPVNMNQSSANEADIEAYHNNPTLTGTFINSDQWHCDAGQIRYEKQGSIILGQNDTMTARLVTDQTAGIVVVRFTINMIDKTSNR